MITFTGAGPGAKDLITLRGKELLEKADIIIYAGSLVNPALLEFVGKDCRFFDSSEMELNEIMDIMIEGERAGKNVVRLHTGDPALYGAIREQMDILDREGISYEYCPGVSSLFGAAAALKNEFTVPEICQSLIITRAPGRTTVPEKEAVSELSAHGAAMAVFLSAGRAEEVSKEFIRGGYRPDDPAAIVYRATWEDERVIMTTVGELPKAASENGIDRCAIIFTGEFLKDQNRRSVLYGDKNDDGSCKEGEQDKK